jgi:hypothetical protein
MVAESKRSYLNKLALCCLCVSIGYSSTAYFGAEPVGVPVSDELATSLFGGHCSGFPGTKTEAGAAAAGFLVCNLVYDTPDPEPPSATTWCSGHWEGGEFVVDCGVVPTNYRLVVSGEPTITGGTHKGTNVLPCGDEACADGYPVGLVPCST